MKKYNYKFMNEEMVAEMDELLHSEHGATLVAHSFECANAGIQGYQLRVAKRGLTVVAIGLGVYATTKLVEKFKKKKTNNN